MDFFPKLWVSKFANNYTDFEMIPANKDNVLMHLRMAERLLELAFEGHRRMDLVRWGSITKPYKKTNAALANWWDSADNYRYLLYKYTEKNKHELLPIPQREKDLCTQFEQNPVGNKNPHKSSPICPN